MAKKVLVVDDEKLIVKGIRFSLEQDGMEVDCAYDGEEALNMAKANEYDMILLDIMLPKMDGFEVCQAIREFSDMPIVMLTAKGDDMDKILGLDYGADDYITKPFDLDELLVRVEAVLNRCIYRESSGHPCGIKGIAGYSYTYKHLIMDDEAKNVTVNGNKLDITAKEYGILRLLLTNPNKLFSKANLFESVWNETYYPEDNVLKVHMSNLRNKIKKYDDQEYIETVWGMGYKLAE